MSEDLVKLFRALVMAEEIDQLIDNIEPTDYGLKYLWDGKVDCHVVDTAKLNWEPHVFIDVQDTEELPKDLSEYRRFNSMSQLVEAMAEPFKCETCGGSGTVTGFATYAGEAIAGEPYEKPCPDCSE